MFLWLKTLYRKRAVTWPFIFYTIIWTLSVLFMTIVVLVNEIGCYLLSKLYKAVTMLAYISNVSL